MICKRCGKCCKIAVIVEFTQFAQDVEEFYSMWGMTFTKEGDVIKGILNLSCPHLKDGNVCTIYESRPQVCRNHFCGAYK